MLFVSQPAEGTKELCDRDRTLQGSSERCFCMCLMSVCMCFYTSCLSRFVVQSASLLSLTSFISLTFFAFLLHSMCKQCSVTASQPPCCPTSSARQRVRKREWEEEEIMIRIQQILRYSDCMVNVGTKREEKGSKDLVSPYGATISSRIMSTDLCWKLWFCFSNQFLH